MVSSWGYDAECFLADVLELILFGGSLSGILVMFVVVWSGNIWFGIWYAIGIVTVVDVLLLVNIFLGLYHRQHLKEEDMFESGEEVEKREK